MLNKIRREESKPVLVLDAGAMLFPQPTIAPSQFNAKTVQAEGLIQAITKMGYDACGLAPQDLSAGARFLLRQSEKFDIPWLSMNLVQTEGPELLFSPHLIKTYQGLSVGVLSLTGTVKPTASLLPLIDYKSIPWENELKRTLASMKDQVDMIILLSGLSEQTNRKIAENFSNIHLIIQSGQSTANKSPQLYKNTLITQIGSRGKYVGRLDIQWAESGRWKNDFSSLVKQTKDSLDRVNWQIGRLQKRYLPEKIEQNAQYEKLLAEKIRLVAELKEIEADQHDPSQQFSTFKSSFIGLSMALPEDPEIREIVLQTKLAVNRTNKRILSDQNEELAQKKKPAFANLAGWQSCRTCHELQADFWQATAHAQAWQTLAKDDQQFNPECLICHVTLPTYDQDTVFGNDMLVNLTEGYKGVGCESCHGPSRNHAEQPEHYRPKKPDEETCLKCHTPERDDSFIYLEKLNRIRCPAFGH